MTKEEFLRALRLDQDKFRDLMEKFVYFLKSLDEAQRDAVRRSMPTITEAARSFGPDVTEERLEDILREILEGIDVVALGCHSFQTTNPNQGTSIATTPPEPQNLE